MIDSIILFSKTGSILYYHDDPTNPNNSTKSNQVPSSVIDTVNQLIDTVLLDQQHRHADKTCTLHPHDPSSSSASEAGGVSLVAEWEEGGPPPQHSSSSSQAGDANTKKRRSRDWLVVILYKEVLSRSRFRYVRDLLHTTLKEFSLFYSTVMNNHNQENLNTNHTNTNTLWGHLPPPNISLFHPTFLALLRAAEKSTNTTMGRTPNLPSQDSYEEHDHDHDDDQDETEAEEEEESQSDADENDTAANIAKLKARTQRAQLNKNNTTTNTTNDTTTKSKKKKQTVWHDGSAKITKSALASLDRSKKTQNTTTYENMQDDHRALQEARAAYLPTNEERPSWEEAEQERLRDEDLTFLSSTATTTTTSSGWMSSLWNNLPTTTLHKTLTSTDLDPILTTMHATMVSKNVAQDIATDICTSVKNQLVGKRLAMLGRVQTAVRVALEHAVERMLSPHVNIDVLRAVVAKREEEARRTRRLALSSSTTTPAGPRPYVIVMVGINGVGKSTSLAKIAYYLKTKGNCHPLIAACDTFRSGAVEQLSVHAKCLEVPLFQRGYAKDPSMVAKAAIAYASSEKENENEKNEEEDNGEKKKKKKGYNDVVLIDTAGRMQNNLPLMRALSKLVVENQPDLVLFVGEALVGNDGIDQLQMFDRALREGGHRRKIDGIVLTKFDTVSDKVGAALTMTQVTGQPVVFVGTGQKYNHLKKLSVPAVIKSIFST